MKIDRDAHLGSTRFDWWLTYVPPLLKRVALTARLREARAVMKILCTGVASALGESHTSQHARAPVQHRGART